MEAISVVILPLFVYVFTYIVRWGSQGIHLVEVANGKVNTVLGFISFLNERFLFILFNFNLLILFILFLCYQMGWGSVELGRIKHVGNILMWECLVHLVLRVYLRTYVNVIEKLRNEK